MSHRFYDLDLLREHDKTVEKVRVEAWFHDITDVHYNGGWVSPVTTLYYEDACPECQASGDDTCKGHFVNAFSDTWGRTE